MNKFAKSLLGVAATFGFLFAGAACSSPEAEKVEDDAEVVGETVEADTEDAVNTVEEDVEGGENDVKDGVEEAVDDVEEHVTADTTVSILVQDDNTLILESLRDRDSLVDALEVLSEDGKLTFTTEDVDGALKITSINDIYAEGDSEWVVYTTINEYDGLAVTDEADVTEYDGKELAKAIVGVNEIPFVKENFFKIVLE